MAKDKGAKHAKTPKYKTTDKQLRLGEKPRLWAQYAKETIPNLQKEFSYKNKMEVPQLKKIVINMGLGVGVQNPNIVKSAEAEMTMITGQKSVVTRAKKSISNFKLREGMPIGCKVTLRREQMWEFLDRLVSVALPRVRDFKGVSRKAFDGRGNYNLGLKDHTIFPEIEYDKVDIVKGMNISFLTTAKTDDEGRALLKELGIPFRK